MKINLFEFDGKEKKLVGTIVLNGTEFSATGAGKRILGENALTIQKTSPNNAMEIISRRYQNPYFFAALER